MDIILLLLQFLVLNLVCGRKSRLDIGIFGPILNDLLVMSRW
jgi:hypothetical protein